MTIERSSSTSASDAARSREGGETTRDVRPPAQPEHIERFRHALDQVRDNGKGGQSDATASAAEPGEEGARVDEGLRIGGREGHGHEQRQDSGHGDQAETTLLDPALLWQAQNALRGEAPQAMPAPVGASNAVMDMIERHVRQLAIGDGTRDAAGDGQVLLRMSDATLPGTDLLLTRVNDGWVLRADVRSRASHDAIREAGPELARRFAERNLGTLRVESHYTG
ncbi:hypothetical protein [Luteimonas sp. MC1825]|uniref:hypothetical protein n=1 Tax=Luteimonas sp. MC1825 TaxID=2761107 RepID=UPI001622A08C|nr:hypothetical protein [Luteimonas sp. MC1825]MBB6600456.1 hypothetical protein [Luteimonas sp. MC1825]QOC88121.1 hypothetical protein IDM46_13070 [Luteimonas sp. MC1825]